jgi:hypothetical protein
MHGFPGFQVEAVCSGTCLAPVILRPRVEWREVKEDLGRFIAPEGLQDSAQGFNPGNHQIRRFALKLKGRESTFG